MIDMRVEEIAPGVYSYLIYEEDSEVALVVQQFHPKLPGFVEMNFEQAFDEGTETLNNMKSNGVV